MHFPRGQIRNMTSNALRPLVMVTMNGQVEYVNDAFL